MRLGRWQLGRKHCTAGGGSRKTCLRFGDVDLAKTGINSGLQSVMGKRVRDMEGGKADGEVRPRCQDKAVLIRYLA